MNYNLEKPEDCVKYLYDLGLEAPCNSVKLGAEITNNANHCFKTLNSIIQELTNAKIDLENLKFKQSKVEIIPNAKLEDIIKSQTDVLSEEESV